MYVIIHFRNNKYEGIQMNQILNDLYGDDNNNKNQSQFNNVKINEKEKNS